MLQKRNMLLHKGCVLRDRTQRAHRFRPLVTHEGFLQSRLQALADRLCDGELAPLVTTLLQSKGTVAMEIDGEISRSAEGEPAVVVTSTSGKQDVAVRQLITTTAQTTIIAADGQTIVLGGGLKSDSDTPGDDLVIILTPTVIAPNEKNSAEPAAAKVISSSTAKKLTNEYAVPIKPGSRIFKKVPRPEGKVSNEPAEKGDR